MTENLKTVLFETTGRFENDPSLSMFRRSIKVSDFLTKYTLHDSYLRLILADDMYYFTLGIEWDGFWNKESLGWTDKNTDLWPYLFISFPTVYKVNWTMLQGDTSDTILETLSQRIEVEHVEEELHKSIMRINKNRATRTELCRTQFKCLYGDIEILHEDPVEIFCVDKEGELINLGSC